MDYDVTNKILSCESNYVVDVAMWPNFGNSSVSMREVITTSILYEFDQKNHFFEGWSCFNFNNLGLTLGVILKLYNSVAKGLKLKVTKIFWDRFYVCRCYRGKIGKAGGGFLPVPSWIGLRRLCLYNSGFFFFFTIVMKSIFRCTKVQYLLCFGNLCCNLYNVNSSMMRERESSKWKNSWEILERKFRNLVIKTFG